MAKEMKAVRKPRAPIPRYSIAEWYGKDMTRLTPQERQDFGRLAAKQDPQKDAPPIDAPGCPFLSTLIPSARCNKAGGVCSIRKYTVEGAPVPGDMVVTTCPSRFLQAVGPGRSLFSWISQKMLDVQNAIVVKETPFLRKIADVQRPADVAQDMELERKEEEKKAGRIDWILVDPQTISSGELGWCAVETQALYFSGGGMWEDFNAYAQEPSTMLFPKGKRRPDYRSSGPKRLWPQLDVKVPVLRAWGKKVVVVVDRFFYMNMNKLADPSPRARSDKERRENAEIAWFIVDYDQQLNLTAGEVIFTTLDSSRHALNATEPLSKTDFTANLKSVIADGRRSNKVFRTSE